MLSNIQATSKIGITIDQVQVKDSPATVPTSEASIECQQEMESSSVEAGDSGEVGAMSGVLALCVYIYTGMHGMQ